MSVGVNLEKSRGSGTLFDTTFHYAVSSRGFLNEPKHNWKSSIFYYHKETFFLSSFFMIFEILFGVNSNNKYCSII